MESPPIDRTEAWLRLILAPRLGAGGIRRLLQQVGEAEAVCAEPRSALEALGLRPETARALHQPDAAAMRRALGWLQQPGHSLLTWQDEDYPALLRRAPNPPAALFVAGRSELLWSPQIAVVGSRNPTAAGSEHAADFARSFARAGFAVTSGLADGIDAAAHQAVLKAGGDTVAVVATGPDLVYPPKHLELAEAIATRGALVSEFPPGTEARREYFPQRNRIIAGLSLGTLVVEAALRSGALITARLAGESGREVFALPGSIHNPLAKGCHRLIREGAALVETSAEVIEALGPVAAELAGHLRQRLQGSLEPTPAGSTGAQPDPDQARLLRALGHDPADLDTLAARSGLTVDALSAMLLAMELEGLVVAEHGRYARRS
jgi:DNA processing protein